VEQSKTQKNIIKATEALRLDKYLQKVLRLPHGLIQRWARKKLLKVNGIRASLQTDLEVGDEIQIPHFEEASSHVGEKKPLIDSEKKRIKSYVIYEDKDIIILNKPAGLAVQGGSKTVDHIDRLLEGLQRKEDATPPKLVHRLDKETSGLLILARTTESAQYLTHLFKTKDIHKTYLAVVIGTLPARSGKVDFPLKKIPIKGHEKMRVDEDGVEAMTLYEVLSKRGDLTFVELKPLTGRTHQLRAHMAALDCPIMGDDKYGGRAAFLEEYPTKRLHLHAHEVEFIHPRTKKEIKIKAPLDAELFKTWKQFGFV
jgi:23S rRNA pseudouridine955/2504/2580 synthase